METNNISCNVIMDLLPLYHDGVCSAESRQLVEEHLLTCSECRELCRNFTIPEPIAETPPNETETFRKVNQKLKHSRNSKTISAVISVFLILFGLWNVSWYFLKYRPYRNLCENMLMNHEYKGIRYWTADKDYAYTVKMPAYLSFEGGFLRVSSALDMYDTGLQINTTKLFIWPQIHGETKYRIMTTDEEHRLVSNSSVMYHINIDKNLQFLPDSHDSPETIEIQRQLFESQYDEIKALMEAAQKLWGNQL